MPEGDTVWLAGKRLHAALAGATLTGSDLRVPSLATVDLKGGTVREVVPRGKHLLFRLVGGPGDGWTLHTHFRMDGTWHIYRSGEPWRGGADHQVRAVLRTERQVVVGYRLPVVDLVRTDDEDAVVGHLGPDVLGPDWDLGEVLRRMAADPQREVGDVLLDQTVLAGLGNIYRTEACFLAGVTPFVPVGELEQWDTTARDVVLLGHRLLQANKDRVSQMTTADPRRGRQHWVFEQRRCLRCSTRVLTATTGAAGRERVAYWCPRCQRGPAPTPVPVRDLLPRTQGRTRYRI